MAPQFIHIEPYGPQGAHKKNSSERKRSMFDIRDELIRAPHACGHVALPRPPVIIFGDHPSTVMTLCAAQAARAIDKAGRKLRCDAPAVVAGVASWPQFRDVVDNNPGEFKRYEFWRNDTVAWLKARWRDALGSVIDHTDERFAHIHFLLIPTLDYHRRLLIGTVHPGRQAEVEAAEGGSSKRDQKRAYETAMRKFQDDYYENVASKHALTRIGPARQRLTRAEWKEQKRQAEALAASHKKARQLAADAKANAERRIAEQADIAEHAFRAKISDIKEHADLRVTTLREKAVHHVTALGGRAAKLQEELKQRDTTIADQAQEIRMLTDMLLRHGILNTPKP
jgi:hypothetical protein